MAIRQSAFLTAMLTAALEKSPLHSAGHELRPEIC
jgi:hypothetical protein